MKKRFDRGLLLLPLEYCLFALALLIALSSTQRQEYLTEEKILASFEQSFAEFDQVSGILWSHPDYFDDLYEKTDVRGLLFNTNYALEGYDGGGYLTEEEWNRLKTLCEAVQPYEIAMRSHGGATAIEWVFTVLKSDQDPYSLNLYYIRASDASSPEKEQAAIDSAVSYFGRYSPLSPVEGKDFWYECTIVPNADPDKSIKTKFKE